MENNVKLRINQIDKFRTIAVMMVLVYHTWVLSGQPQFIINNLNVTYLISTGGTAGVIIFRVLMGFLLFYGFKVKKKTIKEYYVGKFLRIIPMYYLSILIIVLFVNTFFISNIDGIKHILVHLGFLHSFFIGTHGSINGVYWTLGIDFQIIVIFPLIMKILKKINIKTIYISSIIVMIMYRIIVIRVTSMGVEEIGYNWATFIYTNQLIGVMSEYIFGMVICNQYFKNSVKKSLNKKNHISYFIILITLSFFMLAKFTQINITEISFWTLGWNSIFSVIFGGILYLSLCDSDPTSNKIFKLISRLSFNIYLWHLILANQFVKLDFVKAILDTKMRFVVLTIMVFVFTMILSYIFNEFIEKNIISNKEIYFKKFKEIHVNLKKKTYLLVCVIFILVIPQIIKDIKAYDYVLSTYSKNLFVNEKKLNNSEILLENLINKVDDCIKLRKEEKYLYIDNNNLEGTMNYYKIRYYLAPRENYDWNKYAFDNIYTSEKYINLIRHNKIKYVIMRQNEDFLRLIEMNPESKDKIFKVVDNGKKNIRLKEILQEVK